MHFFPFRFDQQHVRQMWLHHPSSLFILLNMYKVGYMIGCVVWKLSNVQLIVTKIFYPSDKLYTAASCHAMR